jgi:hypothetical protein
MEGNIKIQDSHVRGQEVEIVKCGLEPVDIEIDRDIEESTGGISWSGGSTSGVYHLHGQESSTGAEDQDPRVGVVGLEPHSQPFTVKEILSGRNVSGTGCSGSLVGNDVSIEAIKASVAASVANLRAAAVSERLVVAGAIGQRLVVAGAIGQRLIVAGAIGQRFVVAGAIGQRLVVAGAIGSPGGFLGSFRTYDSFDTVCRRIFGGIFGIDGLESSCGRADLRRNVQWSEGRLFTGAQEKNEGFFLYYRHAVFIVVGFFTGPQYFDFGKIDAGGLECSKYPGSNDPETDQEACGEAAEAGCSEGVAEP